MFARSACFSVSLAVASCSSSGSARPVDVASQPVDAGEDTGADSGDSGAGLRFCDTLFPVPTFCADFDEASVLDGWENANRTSNAGITGGATLDGDETVFASPSRSARFTIPALLDTSSRASAFLLETVSGTPDGVDFACDLRVDSDLPSGSGGAVQNFILNFGTDVGYVGVFRSGTRWSMYVFERVGKDLPSTDVTIPGTFPVGEWRPLKVLFRNSADGVAKGEVSVTLGDQSATLPTPASFRSDQVQAAVAVGVLVARGPLETFAMHVDNVRFTVIPR